MLRLLQRGIIFEKLWILILVQFFSQLKRAVMLQGKDSMSSEEIILKMQSSEDKPPLLDVESVSPKGK